MQSGNCLSAAQREEQRAATTWGRYMNRGGYCGLNVVLIQNEFEEVRDSMVVPFDLDAFKDKIKRIETELYVCEATVCISSAYIDAGVMQP